MLNGDQSERLAEARGKMEDQQLRRRGIQDERVLAAMGRVPRHQFVPLDLWEQAYEDYPLPIGEGQTISQPYIVAITLEALALKPFDVVLEVGSGSGYQTALLAELCQRVYAIEVRESLACQAQATLARLGYSNITLITADGNQGFLQAAPYDAIAVSAAAPAIPPALIEQLRQGGRMVIPVGVPEVQQLQLVRKESGKPFITVLEGCRFVPLIASTI